MKKSSLTGLFLAVVLFTIVACKKEDDNDQQATQGDIAFSTNRDNGDFEIYVTNLDGTEQTRLTNSTGSDTNPRWSKDGSKIVFASIRGGVNLSQIYMMNADGSNQQRLTDPVFGGSFPAISPDGTKIAYNSSDGNSSSNAGIYTMNADGSNRKRLGSAIGDGQPVFSHDGNKIVFRSSRTGDDEIYVMNVDGTNQVRLTNETFSDDSPDWSPDGSKIVFMSARNGEKGIYIMNADGSNPTRLTAPASPDFDAAPSFNSDGSKIVFSRRAGGISTRIYTMNINGTGVLALPGTGSNSNPDWK